MNLFTKQKQTHRHRKQTYGYQRVSGGGINWEQGSNWASLIAQLAKNLPAMQETGVRFLGREDPLEKKIATRSSLLAWKISWTEEPGWIQSMGSQESDMTY